jgi:hypothetical protein
MHSPTRTAGRRPWRLRRSSSKSGFFYGYRQQAGRAALRTLLTYEQAEPPAKRPARRRKKKDSVQPDLFGGGSRYER